MGWFQDLTQNNPVSDWIGNTSGDIGNATQGVTDWIGNTSGDIGNATQGVTDWIGNTSGDVAAVVEDVNNAANGFAQTVKDVAAGPMALLKQYWYVPVVVGGVVIAYTLVKKTNSSKAVIGLLSQLAQ